MQKLEAHVRKLLKHANDDPGDHQAAATYQSGFEGEGVRKTEFIVKELQRNERDLALYRIEDCVAVSVGGADGSDLEALFATTSINKAFLIEYSDEGAEAARAKVKRWSQKGKTLSVLQGDAAMRLRDLKTEMRSLRRQGYTTLVSIFLGVLHELPKRSTSKYNLRSYLGTLADVFPNNSIFISEPCTPSNWPEKVEIKISNLGTDLLYRWSLYIKRVLWADEKHPDPEEVGSGYVRMTKALAIETLFKTIRRHDVARHLYEMGERLSSFDPEAAIKVIQDVTDDARVSKYIAASDGFASAYRSCGVYVRRADDGIPCGPPDSHIKISAHSTKRDSSPGARKRRARRGAAASNARRPVDFVAEPPLLKIDENYFIDLSEKKKILFFQEAEFLCESGRERPFRLEFEHRAQLEKRLAELRKKSDYDDEQRSDLLTISYNLPILERRAETFSATLAALLGGGFRITLSSYKTPHYYLEMAAVFERAMRLVWTRSDVKPPGHAEVLVHTSSYKNGPYAVLHLRSAELARAQRRAGAGSMLLEAAEEYEGRVATFSYEARTDTLYPGIIYIFLRDGFGYTLPEEYQSLDNWQVSKP